MRALVVDDEAMARRRLTRMLGGVPGVEVVGEAADGLEAREMIRALNPDVVFLDIRMPGLDGLTLVAEDRGSLPPVVFTTAYDEYAVRAFEAEALDYLLKPIEPQRLREAVDRVRRRRTEEVGARLGAVIEHLSRPRLPPRVSARHGTTIRLFAATDIGRFTARRKYVTFRRGTSSHLTDESLDRLERRLAAWGFIRVHRSELVNLRMVGALHVEGSTATLELTTGERVPVSRRRLAALRSALAVDGGSRGQD